MQLKDEIMGQSQVEHNKTKHNVLGYVTCFMQLKLSFVVLEDLNGDKF